MCADVAGGHAAGVEREDLVIEPLKAPLTLSDDLWLEAAVTITRRVDPDLAMLGAALVACMLGTLLMLADCSFIFTYGKLYFVIGGLGVAYARFGQEQLAAAAAPVDAPPVPPPEPAYRLRTARWG